MGAPSATTYLSNPPYIGSTAFMGVLLQGLCYIFYHVGLVCRGEGRFKKKKPKERARDTFSGTKVLEETPGEIDFLQYQIRRVIFAILVTSKEIASGNLCGSSHFLFALLVTCLSSRVPTVRR